MNARRSALRERRDQSPVLIHVVRREDRVIHRRQRSGGVETNHTPYPGRSPAVDRRERLLGVLDAWHHLCAPIGSGYRGFQGWHIPVQSLWRDQPVLRGH